MAIFHLSVKTLSRSAGRSATAAAAYRAGVEIVDERTGGIYDYTRKGGVESANLVLPENAPAWAADRGALWNAVELAETRKNSTVAREFEVALPAELSPEQRRNLALDFAREIVQKHGCAADVCIHQPNAHNGADDRNHHAHILLSTRRLEPDGFGEKTRELDSRETGPELVTQWRERFAEITNQRLREQGIDALVDHRTLEAQGIDREPTRHLGPHAVGFERRTGEPSRRRLDLQKEKEVQERLEVEASLGKEKKTLLDLETSLSRLIAERARREEIYAKRERERQEKAARPSLWERFLDLVEPRKPVRPEPEPEPEPEPQQEPQLILAQEVKQEQKQHDRERPARDKYLRGDLNLLMQAYRELAKAERANTDNRSMAAEFSMNEEAEKMWKEDDPESYQKFADRRTKNREHEKAVYVAPTKKEKEQEVQR